jgi:hypothetical protein
VCVCARARALMFVFIRRDIHLPRQTQESLIELYETRTCTHIHALHKIKIPSAGRLEIELHEKAQNTDTKKTARGGWR